uniref:TM7S3/TM198-like domain-containing protein n=1 Tax=Haptolina brevifila TaxID=156173 RepID=A0A7S2NK19_9EUKA|mmetsp:Transcript_81157/g.161438  ORF Transcript_81157/g.161438 Transcript_81157/m.161438 type:complete len:271 (+) Transcript_81157:76-888(+)|eukprot:CAMPEP_0174719504 /NCGR_PEP_ID=MMETSP1094-20130205/31255_1 /TAXON_ID=156173 /ORGANISM="Chrysochromulina brevifilum, Strain UTEX LB 985" /LENGTH=270 /DNA_ID=CAMNT_0015919811 /DNA_START=73 /DNA_END=885 /DNA_ORIENTATION=+
MGLNTTTCPIGFLVGDARQFVNVSDALAHLEHEYSTQLASSILVASVLLACSLFILFLGNKLVKPTLCITSFFAAAIATLLVVSPVVSAANFGDTASCITVGVAPIILGLLAAALAACFLNLGFALLGAAAGAGGGYVLYTAFLSRWPLVALGSTNLMLVLCLSLCAIIGMVVMLKQKQNVLILATSAAGACGAVPAIVLLLAHANVKFLGTWSTSLDAPPSFVWPQALLAIVLFVLGLLVQCRLKRREERKVSNNPNGLRNAQVPLIMP